MQDDSKNCVWPHHFIMHTQEEIKVVKITRYCSLQNNANIHNITIKNDDTTVAAKNPLLWRTCMLLVSAYFRR